MNMNDQQNQADNNNKNNTPISNTDMGGTMMMEVDPEQQEARRRTDVSFLAQSMEYFPKASAMDRYLAHLRAQIRRRGYTYRRFPLHYEPIFRPQEHIRRLGSFVIFDERQPMHMAYVYCPFADAGTQILAGKADLPYRRLLSKEDLIDMEKLAYAELVEHAMFFENAPVNPEFEGVTVVLYPFVSVKDTLLFEYFSDLHRYDPDPADDAFRRDKYLAGFELDREDKRAIEDRMDAERKAISASRERILAFGMGTHDRLGAASLVNSLQPEMVMEIVRQFILMHVF